MTPAVYQWAARHGVSMQTLNAKEAAELAGRVAVELAKYGIDGTVNAASYFANQL